MVEESECSNEIYEVRKKIYQVLSSRADIPISILMLKPHLVSRSWIMSSADR